MIVARIYLIKNMKSTLLLLIIILFRQCILFWSEDYEEYLYNLKIIVFNGFQVKYYILCIGIIFICIFLHKWALFNDCFFNTNYTNIQVDV